MAQYFITDGMKTVPFEGGTWDFIDMVANGAVKENALYARVAAVFQAVNKSARAAANVPFALVDIASGDDYDVSWAWENKVKFMPRPKDLIRRVRMSLIMTNKGYLRMGKNVLRQPKKLNFVIPDSIRINVDEMGDLKNLERVVSGQIVQTFGPEDYQLLRFWWLDEKTELVPTDDTEFRAIMNAAEILYFADFFTSNFYKRGGIKPTLIAMKGNISKDKVESEEKEWSKFLRGLGRKAATNVARIFNADTMDVRAFGDGLGDLKETPVYKQALENIAIGLDMPLSILLSNSANRATADTEYTQWQQDGVFPWVEFICDIFNEQLFTPMGLRMEPRPENTDDGKDEAARVQAFNGFGGGFTAYPDEATFLGSAAHFGFELDDDMIAAVTAHYADKKKQAETVVTQTQPANDLPATTTPGQTDTVAGNSDATIQTQTAKNWTPTIDEVNELRVWREVALRRFKKGESLDFEYQAHYGGLPEEVKKAIKAALILCSGESGIKHAFVSDTVPLAQEDSIKYLADAIMELARK